VINSFLSYLGWFIVGYFALVHFGWDNYVLPQWILIALVAFHKQIPLLVRHLYAMIAK
jgi:hypothetical protein